MPSGKTGDLLDPLVVPILRSDQKYVLRGTKTYRTPARNVPLLCTVAGNNPGDPRKVASTDDPFDWWRLNIMPVVTNGSLNSWNSLLWIPELLAFFAASSGGTDNSNNNLAISFDGLFFSGLALPNPGNWNMQQVAYAPSINTICIVSSIGPTTTARVMTSTDGGRSFTARSLPTASIALAGVAWSPTLNLFAAVGNANAVFTSPDGITWTSRTGPTTSRNMSNMIWVGGTINKFFASTIADFHGDIVSSSDGITWTNQVLSPQVGFTEGFGYSPTLGMVIVLDGNGAALARSTNGTSWTTLSTGLGSSKLHSVCWSTALGLWIISTEAGPFLTSPDGVTWTQRTPPSLLSWQRIVATG